MLHARDDLLHLVEHYVGLKLKGGRGGSPPHRGTPPIILAAGGRGGGKSAVLAELSGGYRNRAPRALADISLARYSPPVPDLGRPPSGMPLPQLLHDLKSGLGPEVRGNGGRINFPRLAIALVAIECWGADRGDDTGLTLDQASEELRARRAAIAAIAPPGTDARAFDKWTAAAITIVSGNAMPIPASAFVRAAVDAYLGAIPNARHGDPVGWHRRFDPKLRGDGYDALVMLGQGFGPGGDTRAERALAGAFLADLRAGYSGPAWLSDRAASPLVLLDNVAAHPVGNRFLELVLDCRALPGAGRDPLVVVACGPEEYDLAGKAVRRMPLVPLTASDIDYLLDGANHRLLPPDFAKLTERFTGGMPLAVDALARAAKLAAPRDRPRTGDLAKVDRRQLLDLPVPGAGKVPGLPVAAYVLEHLIPDTRMRERLVTLSSARDRDEARKLAQTYLPEDSAASGLDAAEEILRVNGWADGGDGFVPDPFLRALLLHELSVRPASPSSAQVHQTLRDHYGGDRSGALLAGEPSRLYHCLSLGDVSYVARRLSDLFAGSNAKGWLNVLLTIVAAPCLDVPDGRWDAALGPREEPAEDGLFDGLALEDAIDGTGRDGAPGDPAHDEVQRTVTRLLNAAWYLHDPLVAPDEKIIEQLGDDLKFLAGKHVYGNRVLKTAAREWPARLRDWRQDWKPTI